MSTPAASSWPEAEQRIAEVARTRRGRHRDSALASWRRTRAMELRAGGMSYELIAEQVGYANKGTAHKVIAQALERREVEDVDFLRAVEVGRLNALQAAMWDRAISGNIAACRTILHILDLRSRLLGLYEGSAAKDPKDRWDNCQGPPTVVTHPDDCRWSGCDKHGLFPEVPRSR